MSETTDPVYHGKNRLEALTDGIYSIALTLLVLELKLPALPHDTGDAALREALMLVLPKAAAWLLSFWVMANFWLAQLRLFRLTRMLDRQMIWLELLQLALVSLVPFSTALVGEYGHLPTASALFGFHLLAIASVSSLRAHHLLATPALHESSLTPAAAHRLRVRGWVFVACGGLTCLLGFWAPGWNMLAMVPMALVPDSRLNRQRDPKNGHNQEDVK